MLKRIYLIVFIVLSVQLACAQESIVTDRPDQTESSLTIPHKSFQIERGFGFYFTNNSTSISTPNTLFRLGVSRFFELRFFNEVLINKPILTEKEKGISDLQFGFKWQLFKKDDNKTSIGFLSHLIVPSGSKSLSNNSWGNTSRILFAHQLTDQTSLGYNLGYTYLNSLKGNLIYTLSCAHSITDKFAVFAEIYGNLIEFEKIMANGDAGFTFLIKPNIQLDASYGLGFNEKMNFFSLGVSWNIAPKNSPSLLTGNLLHARKSQP